MNEDQKARLLDAGKFVERAGHPGGHDPVTGIRWEQGLWLEEYELDNWCGTACCLAGYAVVTAAYDAGNTVTDATTEQEMALDYVREYAVNLLGWEDDEVNDEPDAALETVARSLLGLDIRQASRVFAPSNTRESIAAEIAKVLEEDARLKALETSSFTGETSQS